MGKAQDAEILLKNIWKDLENSMSALENGGDVDMASLDKKVRHFCEEIKTLSTDEIKSYNNSLSEIISYLNGIVEKLNAKKNAMREEIEITNHRQRAYKAYGNASAPIYSNNNEAG